MVWRIYSATAAAADPLKRAKIYFLAIFYNFWIFSKICYKTDFLKELAILMGTVKISVKNHPDLWGQIIFSLIFSEKL